MSLLYNLMRDKQEQQNLLSGAQAFTNINNAITNSYQQKQEEARQQAFDTNANMDLTGQAGPHLPVPEISELSTADRYKAQMDAFVKSGNPYLVQKGLEMHKKAFEKSFDGKDGVHSTSGKIAMDLGLMPGTPEFNEFVQKHAMKANSTTIDMGNKRVSASEAANLRYPDGSKVRPGTPWEIAYKNGAQSVGANEQKDDISGVKATNIANELESMLFGKDGIYNSLEFDSIWDKAASTFKTNAENILKDDPRFSSYNQYAMGTLAPLVKSLGESGQLAEGDIGRAMSLIPKLEGFPIDPPAVAREKLNKLYRLIGAGKRKGSITKEMLDQLGIPEATELKDPGQTKTDDLADAFNKGEKWVPTKNKR